MTSHRSSRLPTEVRDSYKMKYESWTSIMPWSCTGLLFVWQPYCYVFVASYRSLWLVDASIRTPEGFVTRSCGGGWVVEWVSTLRVCWLAVLSHTYHVHTHMYVFWYFFTFFFVSYFLLVVGWLWSVTRALGWAILRWIESYIRLQRRPSSLEWGKETSHSFNESARGLSLREANV